MPKSQSAASLLGKIATYTEILAHDPHSTVFVSLCEAYRQMGLLDDALDIAVKGVEALPKFSPGYIALGRIQAQKGQIEPSVSSFKKALSIEPENVEALKSLARVNMLQGNISLARQCLEKVLLAAPDDVSAKKMLASLESKGASAPVPKGPLSPAAEGKKVVSSEEKSSKADGEPISTATIAEIYIRQGFLRRALKVYRDILRAHPQNEDIRQKLVDLKQRIAEDEGTAFQEAAEGSEPFVDGHFEQPGQVPEISHEPVPQLENSHGNEVLIILNSWLDSIQRRKANVR